MEKEEDNIRKERKVTWSGVKGHWGEISETHTCSF